MATRAPADAEPAHYVPSIKFHVATSGRPNTKFAGQFLYDLDRAFRVHLAIRKVLGVEGTELRRLALGSLEGEMAAIVVNQLSAGLVKEAVSAFVPSLKRAIDNLSKKRVGIVSKEQAEIAQTVSEAIVHGNVTQIVIKVDASSPDNVLEIGSTIAKQLQEGLDLRSINSLRPSERIHATPKELRQESSRRITPLFPKGSTYVFTVFKVASDWFGRTEGSYMLIPLRLGPGISGILEEGFEFVFLGNYIYDDRETIREFQASAAQRVRPSD